MEFEKDDVEQIVKETINNEIDDLTTEIISKIGKKLKSLKELENENRTLAWELTKAKSEIWKLQSDIDWWTNKTNEFEKEIKKLEEENKGLRSGNEHYGKIIGSLEEKNKDLRWQYGLYQVEKDKLIKEIANLREENKKLKWAEKQRASWEEAYHKMFFKAQTLQNKLDTLEKENKLLSNENSKLKEIKGRHILDC